MTTATIDPQLKQTLQARLGDEFHLLVRVDRIDAALVQALAARGVLVGEMGRGAIRAVTHYGIDASDIEEALEAARGALAELGVAHGNN